jgi:monofunctional chorismate mutase
MVNIADPAAKLQSLRDSIDNIDAAIIHMLAERFRCTRTVGILKAELELPSRDPGREAEQISRLRHLAEISKLDPDFAEKFLGFVISEVVRQHEAARRTMTADPCAADENPIRGVHRRMIDAWNAGDGAAFAAPFTNDADFVAFEGTHLKGRHEIASFHRRMFETVVKGSRLEGEVKFVHLLGAALAVMHSVVRVTMRGQTVPSAGRDSMQLTVLTTRDGEWRVRALMNARKLTMERQLFLDDLDLLPAEEQRQVNDFAAVLKQRRLPESPSTG